MSREQDWQPIDTAPKDGSHIDLWVSVRISARSHWTTDVYRVCDAWYQDGSWRYNHDDEIKALHSDDVTHWMPIPDPPLS